MSDVKDAQEVVDKLVSSGRLFTCQKELIPQVCSIMDRQYEGGDFQYMIFGGTAHIKRTKKFTKRER